MNIIFKPLEGEENAPHLVEMGKLSDNMYKGIAQIKLAKANAIPFRKENREEIYELIEEQETDNPDGLVNLNWQPDPEKIYSIDGKYEIKEIQTGNRVVKTNGIPTDYERYFQRFAILLKEETIKEPIFIGTNDMSNGDNLDCSIRLSDLVKSAPNDIGKNLKFEEAEKEESQTDLFEELFDLYDGNKGSVEIMSKFTITRIK